MTRLTKGGQKRVKIMEEKAHKEGGKNGQNDRRKAKKEGDKRIKIIEEKAKKRGTKKGQNKRRKGQEKGNKKGSK